MNILEQPPRRARRQTRKAVHPLDQLDSHDLCGRLTVFNPSPQEIDLLMDRARLDLPQIASNAVVRRVAYENPDSFWAIRRKQPAREENSSPPRGFAAFLRLNEVGVAALIEDTFDRTNPPAALLVGQHQRPAAIYVWLVHAKGGTTPALGLVMEKLQSPLYRDVDLIARAVTDEGSHFNDSLGFDLGLWWDGKYYPKIHRYRRDGKPRANGGHRQVLLNLRAPYDSFAPELIAPGLVSITVAHSLDDLMKAVAIRSAVYVGEQDCPHDEEFDGNDFSCSHLIAYNGERPIGCLRIRYFGEFAKLERVAVLASFRRQRVGAQLVDAAADFCRAKGFARLCAHAQTRFLPFWTSLGFEKHSEAQSFVFSDHEYVEVHRTIAPISELLRLGSDPLILIRPEGRWDRQGVLDRSSIRVPRRYPLVA